MLLGLLAETCIATFFILLRLGNLGSAQLESQGHIWQLCRQIRDCGQWFRSYGVELWESRAGRLMRRRIASINNAPIAESVRPALDCCQPSCARLLSIVQAIITHRCLPFTPGTKLDPYEIIAPLGAGGMGEVYRARDARLGRDVALKILTESFANDPDRLHRFEVEARAVAGLNYPILAVFDIGRYNGTPFLVSELLEGESLRALLDRGPLPQRKAIEYGVQIAYGLAAAHEKGIVHRDLKPENIFVTPDGRVKILDFGLAKLVQNAEAEPSELTLTSSHTAAGVIMGTASYMAPEQVRGKGVDARTDIFAFGAVLYEMLTGVRAFRRETSAETMTAVLKDDPPEMSSPSHLVSSTLERIVRRCLEKSPEQRFQSARDLSFALSALSGSETSSAARAVAAAPQRRSLLPLLAVALALAAVAGLTWFVAHRPARTTRMQFALSTPDEMSISHMALSQDGTMLVFVFSGREFVSAHVVRATNRLSGAYAAARYAGR